jgi:hypothetical protein
MFVRGFDVGKALSFNLTHREDGGRRDSSSVPKSPAVSKSITTDQWSVLNKNPTGEYPMCAMVLSNAQLMRTESILWIPN